jgi:hypothetical protein
MATRLKTAREELEVIETNIGLVGGPKRYREINASLGQRKARDAGDVPLDGARRAFRLHNAAKIRVALIFRRACPAVKR